MFLFMGIVNFIPSKSSPTVRAHASREFRLSPGTLSNKSASASLGGGSFLKSLSSTYTWQVPHPRLPSHAPLIFVFPDSDWSRLLPISATMFCRAAVSVMSKVTIFSLC